MLDYWLRNCEQQPTWKAVATILEKITLPQLAQDIELVYITGIVTVCPIKLMCTLILLSYILRTCTISPIAIHGITREGQTNSHFVVIVFYFSREC